MRRFLAALCFALPILFVAHVTPAKAAEPQMDGRFGLGTEWWNPPGRGKKRVKVEQTHQKATRYVRKSVERMTQIVASGPPAGCPSRAWCGCYLSKHLGLNDRSLWVARNWARIGSAASGPSPGVVVVWPHHVGLIRHVTGPGRAVILSGNDGRAVRERERSLRGVIAYRHVGARYAALFQ
jgi:hypothetical protein